MIKRTVAILISLLIPLACHASEPLSVRPSETDRRITEFDSPHLAWLPDGAARNQLLVFLPGTGGKPEKKLFHPFARTAVALGYHVVALMYPNNLASQKKCSQSDDPDAYLKFRNAIIRGGVIGPHRVVAPQDSIENRLEKLLVHLDAKQPGRGWGQFLASGGAIEWRRVAVAGQSQGGGHSYMLGKNHEVARVLMFGSPKDYSFHFDAPAKGFDANTKTPLKRFFAYNHMRDNGNGCTHAQQTKILRKMGLADLGIAEVDNPQSSYRHAHVLYTNADLGSSTKFHASVLKQDLSANPSVWRYMLTEPVD
ncbi:MAG TPA: hypothetical protein VMT89_15325 [Candidatus Acidoferrales bacterium]|nr:hypothetical protein [Candidatus Acidoferrales bacterium]